jgi:hypothetical protein
MKNAKFQLVIIALLICFFSSIDKARKGKIKVEIAAAPVNYSTIL